MPTPRINKSEQDAPYFITITVVEWIDIFTKKEYFDCIVNCLKFCQKNLGLLLYEYVIMTNHIHLIVQADEGYKLSQIISSFKSFTSKEIIKLLKKDNKKHKIRLLRDHSRLQDGTWSQRMEGVAHVSNFCPEHNLYPAPDPDCPVHSKK